jgi:tRNA nucleotidyltransferase (CCA-adding enzyme)
MKVYLVGGAVRDELLGRPVGERDWVVVGATPQQMLDLGYRQVGRDFPVFLHPETGEEHALARTERKTGPGYRGFELQFSPDVTLEDDLRRRDLTINAMARDADGTLIDPHGGRADLESRKLRHVSDAFDEDPVRILRVARFLARFEPLGFAIAPETLARMRAMVASGEADALVPERTWQETARALAEPAPAAWLRALRASGALARIFPELDALYGVPQPAKWHPEIDTGLHMELVLQAAAALTAEPRIRFAALMHDLGKGRTPRSQWPRHIGHEDSGARLVIEVAERLRVPTDYRDLAVLAARWHGLVHRALELRPRTVLELLESCDAFRRPERFRELLVACEADHRGRGGRAGEPYPQADRLRQAQARAAAVALGEADREGLSGEKIGELLQRRRLAALKSGA